MPPSNSAATSLKKSEGVALTRFDLQYSTLEKIFNDDKQIWHSKYNPDAPPTTFYELFVEDFLQSTKLSKSLADRFRADDQGCRETTYIHLLCNVGRINTTLIFTPTQLRLFNPVPCIQVHDRGGKLLQDAPRLKAILKGSCENPDISPPTLEALTALMVEDKPKPLSTPINLLFLISAEENKLVQHFEDDMDYHQLFSRPDLESDDRARAFLFIVWHYMYTNGTADEAARNPYGTGEATLKVPALRACRPEVSHAENVELLREVEYASQMFDERQRWLRNALVKYAKLSEPEKPESTEECKDAEAEDDNASVLSEKTPRGNKRKHAIEEDEQTPASQQRQNTLSRKVGAQPTGQLRTELSLQEFKAKRIDQIMRHRLKYGRHMARKRRHESSALKREAHYLLGVLDEREIEVEESWRIDHLETLHVRRLELDFVDDLPKMAAMIRGDVTEDGAPQQLPQLAGEEGYSMGKVLRAAEKKLAERRGGELPVFLIETRPSEGRKMQLPPQPVPPMPMSAPPEDEGLTPAEAE